MCMVLSRITNSEIEPYKGLLMMSMPPETTFITPHKRENSNKASV